jgi:hypothetical protein
VSGWELDCQLLLYDLVLKLAAGNEFEAAIAQSISESIIKGKTRIEEPQANEATIQHGESCEL